MRHSSAACCGCVCQGVRPLHTLPSPLFSIIFGTHNHPGENPGLSQSSNTSCFGPAPSPLWFTVQIPFSVCVSVYLLHANPVWSVLLFIAVFWGFFFVFSGDSLSACAWLPLPHLERHFMQLGHPIVSFPLLPVGRWSGFLPLPLPPCRLAPFLIGRHKNI